MKKTIIVGVTSSIAIYKSVQLVSDLIKLDYDVEVIMSKNATKFVTPLTFSSLTKHKTYVDTFDRVENYNVEHISLANKADAFLIAPASANVIAKVANGICNDMLTTTFLACDCPKIIAPAMNSKMYNNPITQDNIKKCKSYGMNFIKPVNGLLACGDQGIGKLADIKSMIDYLEYILCPKLLTDKKVLISAGATQEDIDPVRFITNHSSGKQGYALALAARNLGAEVTLVSGHTNLEDINGIKTIKVKSADEMFNVVTLEAIKADIIIKAAAVADYTCTNISSEKIKKNDDELTLTLHKTKDILKYLGEHKKDNQILVGFAMESENLIENAKAKLTKKNCDLIVANSIKEAGAGFNTDTNIVVLIEKDSTTKLEKMSKLELSYKILKKISGK